MEGSMKRSQQEPSCDGDSNSKLQEAFVDGNCTLPFSPEIMEQIFKKSSLLNLKICRFVNRAWNYWVCYALRDRVRVSVRTQEECVSVFGISEEGLKLNLPTLLVQLSARVATYAEETDFYISACLTSEIPITSLTIAVRVDRAALLLRFCAPTLTDLKTFYYKALDDLRSLSYPNLRALSIQDRNYQEEEPQNKDVQWFLDLIRHSPRLQYVQVNGDELMEQLLPHFNLSQVRTLDLEISESEALESLSSAHLPNLRGLTFSTEFCDEDTLVMQVISQHSSHLRQIRLQAENLILRGNFPYFPYLRHLHIYEFEAGRLDLSSCPLLETFSAEVAILPEEEINTGPIIACSETVRTVIIEYLESQDCPVRDQNLLLTELLRDFPRAINWTLNYFFVSSFCRLVRTRKILIRKLGITYGSRELRRDDQNERLDAKGFRSLALLPQLQELEMLNIEWHIDIYKLNFSVLPNLKVWRFYFLDPLYLRDAAEELKHLDEITLLNPVHRSHCWKELEGLFDRFPNLACGYHPDTFN